MKVIIYTALLTLLTSFAIAQSLVPIDRPEAKSPKISEAFDGKTTVRRTIDASGLVHYMIRFFHEDVISPKRPHLSEVVLSITNDEGKVITQSVLEKPKAEQDAAGNPLPDE